MGALASTCGADDAVADGVRDCVVAAQKQAGLRARETLDAKLQAVRREDCVARGTQYSSPATRV